MTRVRSIRVFSAAKINALLYGIMGLLFAPFFLLGPGLAMLGGGRDRQVGFGSAIFVAAILPVCYAILGFIAGAVMAFIYNAIAMAVGGLEVELELPPSMRGEIAQPSGPTQALLPPETPPSTHSEFE